MIVHGKEKLKSYILNNYNQVDILAHYFNVSVEYINYCIDLGRPINNPLRVDRNPSLLIYWALDKDQFPKLRIYDRVSTIHRGDIFDVVGLVLRKQSNSPKFFIEICNHIIQTIEADSKLLNFLTEIKNKKLDKTSKPVSDLDVWIRSWTKSDLNYWIKIGLTEQDLNTEFVYPITKATINGKLLYLHKPEDPAYAYWLGKETQYGKDLYKIYYPTRKKDNPRGRFNTNNKYYIEGITFLKPKEILVLTKSRKDAIVLKKILRILNYEDTIEVSNFSGESVRLTETTFEGLNEMYKDFYINVDFDKGGYESIIYHYRKFGFKPILLTNGKFGTVDFKAKDISDYVRAFGFKEAVNLVQHGINFCKEYYQNNNIWLND